MFVTYPSFHDAVHRLPPHLLSLSALIFTTNNKITARGWARNHQQHQINSIYSVPCVLHHYGYRCVPASHLSPLPPLLILILNESTDFHIHLLSIPPATTLSSDSRYFTQSLL